MSSRPSSLNWSAILMIASSGTASAQALSEIHIGDAAERLNTLAAHATGPEQMERTKMEIGRVTMRKWSFADGNDLAATVWKGRVVYLEVDWGGRPEGATVDFPGLRFGETTLSGLRAKFGNNGFAFKQRAPVIRVSDGVATMNSYEVGDVIVTFVTHVSYDDVKDVKQTDLPAAMDRAKLVAISLTTAEYAVREWGDRIYDPNYKKIEWK